MNANVGNYYGISRIFTFHLLYYELINGMVTLIYLLFGLTTKLTHLFSHFFTIVYRVIPPFTLLFGAKQQNVIFLSVCVGGGGDSFLYLLYID